MTKPNDAGQQARTGEDESHQEKSTEGVLGYVADGALAGAVLGGLYGLAERLGGDGRDRGYYAERDQHGGVELTYVPEVGDERLAASLNADSAEGIYAALTADDGESDDFRVDSTASGEFLNIRDKNAEFDFPVMQILAEDRDSLEDALAEVLDEDDETEEGDR